ncbi:hypothetical protein CH341_20425 [Rhodoplanes roseus]|uniref:UVR domain-containing protein n=2 Tax=Rhodoplanes roseus TaxID=29409 RepID=A0A327KVB8_9BRAD|nr:hypothetical protein CH341_20425 [Rhodoplanes roseus]
MRKVTVRLHDTHIGIWQDDARDPSFSREIYGGLIRHLRGAGWKVRVDPQIKRNYSCLSPSHRLAAKGALRASIKVSGRVVEMDVWAETWPQRNPNGHRYDFDKRARLAYLDRLRLTLEERRVLAWLGTVATIESVKRFALGIGPGFGEITALAHIADGYAKSWHSDKALGRPICTAPSYSTSADGGTIEHGVTVWFPDGKGRILRGTAYYNINNMWWVVAGPWTLQNLASFQVYTRQPDDLRRKRNDRLRRERLEQVLGGAIGRMDFRKAETLRRLLFGAEQAFMIWSEHKEAYYRPQGRGYTTDAIRAGRYTKAEAEAEVRSAPDRLRLVTPEGRLVRLEVAA